jgi:hypothetical protein
MHTPLSSAKSATLQDGLPAAPQTPLTSTAHPVRRRARSTTGSAASARTTGAALEACYRFLLWLIPTLEKFPRSQKFLLGDRIQSQGLAVLGYLIAATYRPAQRQRCLEEANLELEHLRFGLRLAKDLKHLDFARYEFAARSVDEIGKLVGGWLKSTHASQAIPAV